jgi:hypothetical protein
MWYCDFHFSHLLVQKLLNYSSLGPPVLRSLTFHIAQVSISHYPPSSVLKPYCLRNLSLALLFSSNLELTNFIALCKSERLASIISRVPFTSFSFSLVFFMNSKIYICSCSLIGPGFCSTPPMINNVTTTNPKNHTFIYISLFLVLAFLVIFHRVH